ncbi:Formyltransferase [Hypoxylon sp. NC1633]|nr:Formyltransferase [Hypoxylon sp. NC1633]
MQKPLRRAIAAAFRSRAWRELPADPGSLPLLRHSGALPFRTQPRNPAPMLRVCRRCQLMRRYHSSNTTAPTTAAAADAPPESETELNGKENSDKMEIGDRELKIKKTKTSEPLRILFCGSDEFSCASLQALYDEHRRDPGLIESIDVVVRPGKRTGRGYKVVQHPPIRELAEKLALPIHERDTFTGWDMPQTTNLIIAVSFGLFIPPRLLHQSKFGGLNIHPSLLPDLRGPAPIQHTILAARRHTGVSLQTLHHAAFDRGTVLARSRPVAVPPDAVYTALRERLQDLGARLLVRGLRARVYVPPLEEVPELSGFGEMGEKVREGGGKGGREGEAPRALLHAPKISKQDRQVTAKNLPLVWRRFRALGPLWFWARECGGARRRVIVERMSMAAVGDSDGGGGRTAAAEGAALLSSPPLLIEKGEDLSAVDGGVLAGKGTGVGAGLRPYLVLFEEDDEGGHGADIGVAGDARGREIGGGSGDGRTSRSTAAAGISQSGIETGAKRKYLLLWLPEPDGSSNGSAGAADGACYLGPYRLETLKVEGDKAKPAARALKDFLVPAFAAAESEGI